MRILDLYQDYSVDHITETSRHRHATTGWVNTHCPFCVGSHDYHLGYSLEDDYFNCWRCGFHRTIKVIIEILDISYDEAKKVVKQYGGDIQISHSDHSEPEKKPFRYPSGTTELLNYHKQYLEDRKYDPNRIVTLWNIAGTGPSSFLDGINYSKRIIAPIHWKTKAVSFQARALNSHTQPKYKACPITREYIHHQHILYGMPQKWTSQGICVEGIFDVWRIGYKAFGVFGINYTQQQIVEIVKHFEEIIILFDPEPQAQIQARKLKKNLEAHRLKVYIENIDTDPGDLTQDDANHLVRQLTTKFK